MRVRRGGARASRGTKQSTVHEVGQPSAIPLIKCSCTKPAHKRDSDTTSRCVADRQPTPTPRQRPTVALKTVDRSRGTRRPQVGGDEVVGRQSGAVQFVRVQYGVRVFVELELGKCTKCLQLYTVTKGQDTCHWNLYRSLKCQSL